MGHRECGQDRPCTSARRGGRNGGGAPPRSPPCHREPSSPGLGGPCPSTHPSRPPRPAPHQRSALGVPSPAACCAQGRDSVRHCAFRNEGVENLAAERDPALDELVEVAEHGTAVNQRMFTISWCPCRGPLTRGFARPRATSTCRSLSQRRITS